jgi:hypothetical protein
MEDVHPQQDGFSISETMIPFLPCLQCEELICDMIPEYRNFDVKGYDEFGSVFNFSLNARKNFRIFLFAVSSLLCFFLNELWTTNPEKRLCLNLPDADISRILSRFVDYNELV